MRIRPRRVVALFCCVGVAVGALITASLVWAFDQRLAVLLEADVDRHMLLEILRPALWESAVAGIVALVAILLGMLYIASRVITRQAADLSYHAYHDSLTNLPNRSLFLERVGRALDPARLGSVAVLFLDLDNFKDVNDSLGHSAGDRFLVAVAERLRGCLRPGDTVARLGGDEFTVLLDGVGDLEDATRVAERIGERLTAPFFVDGHEVAASASIGIALSSSPHEQPEDLLRHADVAMYRAKSTGKAHFEVFDQAMGPRATELRELEIDLQHALERGELQLEYQPIVELRTGRILEVEALLRWQHPRRGLLDAATFVPLAEESGLMVPIGGWVLEQACRQGRLWQSQYPADPPLVVSVNLSARQLQHPELVDTVSRVLRESGLAASTLEVEIAESAAMEDAAASVETLRQLKELGVQVAIDDFGTGYSSMAYLNRFPIDTLKIDRSFVARLGDDLENRAVVRTIVALARALNLVVVGEGVETAEQSAHLRAQGCEQGQGYYFGRPQMGSGIEALLAATARRAA